MKRYFSFLFLLLVLPVKPIGAKETLCSSEAVTNAYNAAVAEGIDPQQWYQSAYANSNCSDNIKAFAESLVIFQYHYQGQDYPIFNVPTDDGVVHHWALVKKGRKSSQFIDPANPDAGMIEWTGSWRTLAQVFAPTKMPIIPTVDATHTVSVDVKTLRANLFENLALERAVLSPDGAKFATIDRQVLCIYTFADDTKNCFDFPDPVASPSPALYWSSDGNVIALTEDYAQNIQESDIWLFNTTTKEFSDMTDDHISGNYTEMATQPFDLDYIPTWNPATSDLFFIRSQFQAGNKTFNANLYRLSVNTGEIHQIIDLSKIISTSPSPLCMISDLLPTGPTLHGVMTISPDGKILALLVRNFCAQSATGINAEIWLIDLTGQNNPRLLVKQSQLKSGMPAFRQDITLIPSGIAWAGDTGLLVSSSNIAYRALLPSNNAYYVDVASGSVVPIMDFSKGEEAEFDGSQGTYYDVPFGFSVSPDGKKLIMVSQTPALNVLSLDLPPNGKPPVRIYTTQSVLKTTETLFSTVSRDGNFFMQGLLITIHPS